MVISLSFKSPDEIRSLLASGEVRIDELDEFRWTHLMQAAFVGNLERSRILLDRGADIYHADDYGQNALHNAARAGSPGVCALLLDRDEKLRREHKASPAGGGSPFLHARDVYRCDALHHASHRGNAETVRLLLERGGNPNRCMKGRWNALHRAAVQGNVEIVRVLLSVENLQFLVADAKNHLLPVHLACDDGHHEIMRMILEKGPTKEMLDATNRKKQTLLHMVLERRDPGDKEFVQYLLEKGAAVRKDMVELLQNDIDGNDEDDGENEEKRAERKEKLKEIEAMLTEVLSKQQEEKKRKAAERAARRQTKKTKTEPIRRSRRLR